MHSRKENWGTPRFNNNPGRTSCELETCPTWQLGAGLDGDLSSQPPLRALYEASSTGRRWPSPNTSPKGAVSLGQPLSALSAARERQAMWLTLQEGNWETFQGHTPPCYTEPGWGAGFLRGLDPGPGPSDFTGVPIWTVLI